MFEDTAGSCCSFARGVRFQAECIQELGRSMRTLRLSTTGTVVGRTGGLLRITFTMTHGFGEGGNLILGTSPIQDDSPALA
jgi:hypothetical protein